MIELSLDLSDIKNDEADKKKLAEIEEIKKREYFFQKSISTQLNLELVVHDGAT